MTERPSRTERADLTADPHLTAGAEPNLTARAEPSPTPDADHSPTDPIDRAAAPAAAAALSEFLLALADDDLVIGFSDSEWTGIAPLLEEDVAMSSLAQDEIGHARALYELLAALIGSDADRLAYDRPPEAYRHARLLDHARGDWATAIARRYLFDTAKTVRLEALLGSSHRPLAELVAKIRREEVYHLLHVETWLERLARAPGEARTRLLAALAMLGPDASSVLAPFHVEPILRSSGILPASSASLLDAWHARVGATFARLDLPPLPATVPDPVRARHEHGEPFRWLWAEFTSVRQLDPTATW